MLLSDLKRNHRIQTNAYLYLFLDNTAQKTCNILHGSDSLIISLCSKSNDRLKMTCCSEEHSAAKSSVSQGPLPLKEVPWNIGISRAQSVAFVWEKPLWHPTRVVSSSCPILIWESRKDCH